MLPVFFLISKENPLYDGLDHGVKYLLSAIYPLNRPIKKKILAILCIQASFGINLFGAGAGQLW